MATRDVTTVLYQSDAHRDEIVEVARYRAPNGNLVVSIEHDGRVIVLDAFEFFLMAKTVVRFKFAEVMPVRCPICSRKG